MIYIFNSIFLFSITTLLPVHDLFAKTGNNEGLDSSDTSKSLFFLATGLIIVITRRVIKKK